jgi:hypothetical protein
MKNIKYLSILLPALLISCAETDYRPDKSVHNITTVSNNIYKSTYGNSWAESIAWDGAKNEARAFCENQGKEYVSRSASERTEIMTTYVSIIFSCFDYNERSKEATIAKQQRDNYNDRKIELRYQEAEQKRIRDARNLREREVRALEGIQRGINNPPPAPIFPTRTNCRTTSSGNIRCTSY